MKKEKIHLDTIMLIGQSARTNNKDEMEPGKGKIGPMVGTYFAQQAANLFKHRSKAGVTYCVYTDFETDENGEYTYFIGEQVDSFDDQDTDQFKTLTIQPSSYQKFTTESGKIPDVVISAWQSIWQMNESDFGGKRSYKAELEIHDQRVMDPNNAVVDIYIGIE